MSNKAIVLDANILIRAVLGKRARGGRSDLDYRPRRAVFIRLILNSVLAWRNSLSGISASMIFALLSARALDSGDIFARKSANFLAIF